MTVLRSRETLSTVTPKIPQPLALENVIVEPVTPSKSFELLNHSSNSTTPSSSSLVQNDGHPELGLGSSDVMVCESGTVRRRSVRLVKKVGAGACLENVEIVNGKRKKVEGSSCNRELDVRNLERRVLELKFGVENSVGVTDVSVSGQLSQDLSVGGVTELVTDPEEVKDGETVVELESDYDVETFTVETVNGGRRKRKLSIEGKSLGSESNEKDDVEKGFLSLRSGKRVGKRVTKDDNGLAGISLEGIENSKESGNVLSGHVPMETTSEAFREEDKSGHRKERRFSRGEKGKGKVGSAMSGSISVKFEVDDDGVGQVLGDSNCAGMNLQKNADSKEVVKVKGDIIVETGVKTRGMSKEDKGKMKLGVQASSKEVVKDKDDIMIETGVKSSGRLSKEDKGKMKLGVQASSEEVVKDKGDIIIETGVKTSGRLSKEDKGKMKLGVQASSKEVLKDKDDIIIETGVKTRRRLSKEDKGKMKLGAQASSSNGVNTAEVKVENVNGNSVPHTVHSAANESSLPGVQVREADAISNAARRIHRERFRNIARRNASRFAHFSSQEELGNRATDVAGREIPPEADSELEDWPGPFSTAVRIIKDGKRRGASTDKSEAAELKWIPKKQESHKRQKQVPLLEDLCLSVLSKNADAIASLDFVPDMLRHKICWSLCDSRRMDSHFLELLVHGSPTEIRLRDCSWLSEELFTKIFEGCNASKLTVLQFDQCGSCMPDYTLHATLARSINSLPALTTISLKGAYRLSDAGLSMLVSAAPSLKSIDISQCPLLTSEGICCLANSLRLVLRELYLDNCHGIDAMSILTALLKLNNLEVLSLTGIQTVYDDFVNGFVSRHGCRMKELVLADCLELTDSSLKVIGDNCSELRAIDLSNLCKLTDVSIRHLANGCQAIQMLKFCRNAFSDEAIAAYLDVRGAFLEDLSLNNVVRVSNHTALSLARNCRNLRSLDLSWCRNLTNEALGLVVDTCSSLEVLKLFGCTQASNVFLDGHSNPQVKLIGLKMTSVFKHIDVPDFLSGPLRYSSISS